jgi:large subunit ribosomal protein L4
VELKMAIVKIYDIEGRVVEEHEVPLSLEIRESDQDLLSRALKRQQSNARRNYAAVKGKGMVSGGGAKPWRQKGTGRARHGSSRSPIWRHGGVIWGPTMRTFTEKMNRKERRRAMQVGLMSKITEEDFLVVDGMNMEKPSTKEGIRILANLNARGGKTLFLADRDEDPLFLSFRNISKTMCLPADRINGFDLLNNDKVVATKKAYELIEEVWLS